MTRTRLGLVGRGLGLGIGLGTLGLGLGSQDMRLATRPIVECVSHLHIIEHERLPYRLPCTAGIWHTGLYRVPPVFTIPVRRYKKNSVQTSNSLVTGMFGSKQLGTGDAAPPSR